MKGIFVVLRIALYSIAGLIFLCGIVLTFIGAYDFIKAFYPLFAGEDHTPNLMAIGLLHAIDAFLVATVFFILSIGIVLLFSSPETKFPVALPEWLRVKSFMELKAILWEAILTTLVVTYLARMAEEAMEGKELGIHNFVIPGGIFLIALSLYFLKKGEKH